MDELACVNGQSILSLNNHANSKSWTQHGHRTLIITSFFVCTVTLICQDTYPGPYCMKFLSFIDAIIMAASMLYMGLNEKCVRPE